MCGSNRILRDVPGLQGSEPTKIGLVYYGHRTGPQSNGKRWPDFMNLVSSDIVRKIRSMCGAYQ